MRFQAKVEVAEAIIKTSKLGQAEAIEVVFNCKRSGQPDSPYARARAAITARSEAQYRTNQDWLMQLQAANGHEE